ncbi:plant expansin, partial [Bombardia bombarda]
QKTYTGDLTYYNLGLGACGETSSNADMAVAVAHSLFDAAALEGSTNPNENPLCGRTIRVSRDYAEIGAGVISVLVKVVDRCVGCEPTDLDLSPAVYDLFAPEEKGRVPGQWEWA